MTGHARAWAFGLLGAASVWAGAGCGSGGDDSASSKATAVVYASLDEEFSRPILEKYAAETGVDVKAKYDVESTKTVGLTNLLIEEAGRTRCDLFWNNEILNTLRLREKGLLQPIRPANADAFPDAFKGADGTWFGFAARARILLIDTRQVTAADRPRGINDLAEPKWRGRVGIAKPLAGTTATHAACLFEVWGEEKAKAYFQALKANDVKVFAGNKQVAKAVASGEIAVGLTDTDDAMVELDAGELVAIVYPDKGAGELGTLFIPNTLCVMKGAPHPEAAEALANFLLGAEIEKTLAEGPSAQIPLRKGGAGRARVETPESIEAMKVDFVKAAARWDSAARFLQQEFAGP